MYHYQKKQEVLESLSSNPQTGLSTQQVEKLTEQYGPNRLKEKKKKSNLQRFFDQFKDVMIIILLIAAAISFGIACVEGDPMEFFEPVLILLIVILNAIMGMMLYSALFTDEELLRNYDFYQTVTLHHSSLSTCIFGILASRIGRHEDAYTYFAQSARMDLDDYHDNFYAGIHAANMAGTWQSIVFGFAGLRLVNGVPEFKFYIPEAWNGYHFTVKIKESVLAVDVLPDGWTITLQSGDAVNFLVEGKPYELTEKGASCHETL